jgi:rare lipoprotein A
MRLRIDVGVVAAFALASCGSFDGAKAKEADQNPTATAAPAAPVASVPDTVKIGEPYQAMGQSYTPSDEARYDDVGYASWYGAEMAGKPTGNGETFNPDGITAAHRTLPMPSFAEVTNLDTGRTILVRVNDRGPFAKDRILDLSQGAARQLGVEGQGHFPVRVRRVYPREYERTALANGQSAVERLPTPPALLNALRKKLGTTSAENKPVANVTPDAKPQAAKPPAENPAAKPKPPKRELLAKPKSETEKPAAKSASAKPPPGNTYIQIAALSDQGRATALAKKVGGSVQASGKIWRVRAGPYANEAAARAALGPLAAKGYRDAQITH